MNREIPEFRAWVKDLKEYRVVASLHYVLTNKEWTAIPSYVTLYGNKWTDKAISRAIQDVVLEQSTGFKDKNGKKIYSGDIFRNVINGGIWRVTWDEKDAAFWVDSGVARCSLGEFDWDRRNRKYGFIRKNCEVIGNVHESNMEKLCLKK